MAKSSHSRDTIQPIQPMKYPSWGCSSTRYSASVYRPHSSSGQKFLTTIFRLISILETPAMWGHGLEMNANLKWMRRSQSTRDPGRVNMKPNLEKDPSYTP